ncbi:MAG: prepilin-type cleavage/methylation domain-containing protein [Holophaga sp.]
MRIRKGSNAPSRAQLGFSMVEMLMTAFVLAIGILGLTMLQTMSLKASRGSKSLSTAVLVAEQIMDQAEMEGRLSWLNITDPYSAAPNMAVDLPNLRYVNLADGGKRDEVYNSKGGLVDATSTDPIVKTTFYSVTTTRTPVAVAATGRMSDIRVIVQFTDNVDANGANIQREVSLTRRIIHG